MKNGSNMKNKKSVFRSERNFQNLLDFWLWNLTVLVSLIWKILFILFVARKKSMNSFCKAWYIPSSRSIVFFILISKLNLNRFILQIYVSLFLTEYVIVYWMLLNFLYSLIIEIHAYHWIFLINYMFSWLSILFSVFNDHINEDSRLIYVWNQLITIASQH